MALYLACEHKIFWVSELLLYRENLWIWRIKEKGVETILCTEAKVKINENLLNFHSFTLAKMKTRRMWMIIAHLCSLIKQLSSTMSGLKNSLYVSLYENVYLKISFVLNFLGSDMSVIKFTLMLQISSLLSIPITKYRSCMIQTPSKHIKWVDLWKSRIFKKLKLFNAF